MSAGAVTLADITSADWSLKLGAIGQVVQGVADVDQCVAIILTTPTGSDPLRPTFGCDIWRYLDHPISEALPAIVRELKAALTLWEPRITLLSVAAVPVLDTTTQSGAHLNVSVTWQLKLSGPAGAGPNSTTTVTLGAAAQ
ncbi:MAG TPA: GPW/gp25 family protein [Candidatus Binataceae bacterium]|nr:GPW/gp25 family protein [Candidatus Binataceae bacterium]